MAVNTQLVICLAAEVNAISVGADAVRVWGQGVGLPATTLSALELGIVEALNNIVVHAYRGGGLQPIELSARRTQDYVEVSISDRGQRLATPPTLSLPLDPLQEGGRGWFIMNACFDDIDYTYEFGKNRLTLRKYYPQGD